MTDPSVVREKVVEEEAPYTSIGKSVPHPEGVAKVTGKAQYGTDVSFPGMLYGKILLSDRPHAQIVRLDVSKALALEGVEALVTGAEAPNVRYGLYLRDRWILAKDRVRFAGEPLAAVAARSERLAAEALGLIEVEYQDLPAVLTPEEALAPEAPVLHPGLADYQSTFPYIREGNVCMQARLLQGDPDTAFAQADHIFEHTYETDPMHQAALEPHACVAHYDQSGRLTVWTSTQQLSVCHAELAMALDLPMTKVRVVPVWLGGGFGGKLKSQFEPLAALLARASGKPVRLTLTREEEFITAHARAPFKIRLKTGVMADGTLVAREVDILTDVGAYSDHAIGTATHAITVAQGPYRIPHCRVRSRAVYTNNLDYGCVRGYGVPQANFASESQIDEIALALEIDPAELRLKNLAQEGDPIISTQPLRCVQIRETMEAALEASGYWEKKDRMGPNRGIGIANLVKATGFLASSAFVRMNEDATVTILTAITDIGSGTHTVLCQIAAEVLGVPVDEVQVANPDSDSSPYDLGSIGSRTIYDAGNAVRLASEDVRRQLAGMAAQALGCEREQIALGDRRAYRKDDPSQELTLAALVGTSLYVRHGPLIGHGSWLSGGAFEQPVGEGYAEGPYPTFAFGTHVAEVEVDPETGLTQVLAFTACHDVGKVLNPKGLEGQVEGGVAQGLASGLLEVMQIEGGVLQNPNFTDYRIPTALDIPAVTSRFIEVPDPTGPFGAKGVGEHPIIAPAPAIANAIAHASGARVRHLPITNERLFYALKPSP